MIQASFCSESSRHYKSLTISAIELKLIEIVHPPPFVTCHVSHVMCHVSGVKCKFFFLFNFFLFKVDEYVWGWSVINGATRLVIVSLGELINQRKFQHDSSTHFIKEFWLKVNGNCKENLEIRARGIRCNSETTL